MAIGLILTTFLAGDIIGTLKDRRLVDTPYGPVEHAYCCIDGQEILILRRSAGRNLLPPHRVNYLANMFSFASVGIQNVIATNIVGSLRTDIPPGSVVVPDQFLDATRHRPPSIFDSYGHRHVDITDPFCERLRKHAIEAGADYSIDVVTSGTYVAVDGPRFETRAEVRAFAALGGDVIGMTCATEAILARELSICFASVALVSNYAAGVGGQEALDASEMVDTARVNREAYLAVLRGAVADSLTDTTAQCCARDYGVTRPGWRDVMLGLTDEHGPRTWGPTE